MKRAVAVCCLFSLVLARVEVASQETGGTASQEGADLIAEVAAALDRRAEPLGIAACLKRCETRPRPVGRGPVPDPGARRAIAGLRPQPRGPGLPRAG